MAERDKHKNTTEKKKNPFNPEEPNKEITG